MLVERIRKLKPDVVLTFGLDGGPNTHPDHTMVSCLTTAAFHWAASQRFPNSGPVFAPSRLFHVVIGFFIPGRPLPLPSPWTVNLDIGSVFDVKREAFRQHTSQAPLMHTTKALFDQFGATEYYNLVATASFGPARISKDLFDGLE